MYPGLLQWLEDYIGMFEDVEMQNFEGQSDYNVGYILGCFNTQEAILQRLRYAIGVEKERIKGNENPTTGS
jgi:hypothetical protein